MNMSCTRHHSKMWFHIATNVTSVTFVAKLMFYTHKNNFVNCTIFNRYLRHLQITPLIFVNCTISVFYAGQRTPTNKNTLIICLLVSQNFPLPRSAWPICVITMNECSLRAQTVVCGAKVVLALSTPQNKHTLPLTPRTQPLEPSNKNEW